MRRTVGATLRGRGRWPGARQCEAVDAVAAPRHDRSRPADANGAAVSASGPRSHGQRERQGEGALLPRHPHHAVELLAQPEQLAREVAQRAAVEGLELRHDRRPRRPPQGGGGGGGAFPRIGTTVLRVGVRVNILGSTHEAKGMYVGATHTSGVRVYTVL